MFFVGLMNLCRSLTCCLKVGIIAIFVIMSVSSLEGQSNIISKKLTLLPDCKIKLDHKWVLPSSIKVWNNDIPISVDRYDANDSTIYLICDLQDSLASKVKVEYRVFNQKLDRSFSLYDTSKMKRANNFEKIVYDFTPTEQKTTTITSGSGLNYNGSFSRGISVGNSQSLVLNSNFDLQMSGDLGNGLRVIAAISDDNIPIQPEGNTQVLQEFDKVFIEVSKDRNTVLAGDYEMRRPNSYFMNYQKKLKGLSLQNVTMINEDVSVQTRANIASSRGKFARQILKSKEGNQGPYRLQGNNNERFIIVLSNQEKVYFNGILLRRGIEYDYVIDYNTAEITFSPTRLVVKESRIIVEFEYTDLNYFRTLYSLRTDVGAKKYNFNINYYSEQDSKTSTSQIALDSTDLAVLEQSGDKRSLSFRSGIRPLDNPNNSSGNITYEQVLNPNYPAEENQYILKYSVDRGSELFIAAFSEVGVNKGSYDIDLNVGVNGRIYKYVGKNKGKYDPVVELIPPEKKQMTTIGGQYRLGESNIIKGEFALSSYDANRFSPINDSDNNGIASYIEFNNEYPINESKSAKVYANLKTELLSQYFKPLNPYRNAEFIRDWNVDSLDKSAEQLYLVETGLKSKKWGQAGYAFSTFDIAGVYNGSRNQLNVDYRDKGWTILSTAGLTKSERRNDKTTFIRPNFELRKQIAKWDGLTLGVSLESEKNTTKAFGSDSIFRNGYAFNYVRYQILTNDKKPINFRFSYNTRNDDFASKGVLERAINIREWELASNFQAKEDHKLSLTLINRVFDVTRADLASGEKSKNTLIGSVDHQLFAFRKAAQFSTNYQLASGQEPRLEFVFQKVANNLGDYVYVGSDTTVNKNISDFRYDPSNPSSSYIRISLPNNEFITTNNLGFNHNFRLDPSRIWEGDSVKNNWKQFISRFNNVTTMRINTKASLADAKRPLNPFEERNDTELVSYNSLFTNNVFFNRGNPKFDMVLTNRNNAIKINQLNGIEARVLIEDELRVRNSIWTNTDFIITVAKGVRSFDSKLFNDRDFSIKFAKVAPEISYRPSTSFRLSVKYRYEQRNQTINILSKAINQDIAVGINKRVANKSALDLTTSFVKISYDGNPNLPVAYDMLDGLRNGNNVLWNISYTRRLNGVLDLNINYEGRKAGEVRAIHVGRGQLKATF